MWHIYLYPPKSPNELLYRLYKHPLIPSEANNAKLTSVASDDHIELFTDFNRNEKAKITSEM